MINHWVLDAMDDLLFTLASKLRSDVVLNTLKSLETYFDKFIDKSMHNVIDPLTWS